MRKINALFTVTFIFLTTLVALFYISRQIDAIPTSSYAEFRAYFVDRWLARQKQISGHILPSPLTQQETPGGNEHPTLADLWDGSAHFIVDIPITGLPMGESETIRLKDGQLASYVHASQRSAGVVDQCGDPVAFPGCITIYRSNDDGQSFTLDEPPVCQIPCNQCPCESEIDQIDQQQYPRVDYDGRLLHMVYEYRGITLYRYSTDGLDWSTPEWVPGTGVWQETDKACPTWGQVGEHPHTNFGFDCLVGGPPGVFTDGGRLYIFVGTGQNPGAMGCYVGPADGMMHQVKPCANNPLFVGAETYGPLDERGPGTNPFFDFRTISSAEVQKIDDRFYMLYEGVRGPGPDDPGDTQFGLGLARSSPNQIDSAWEVYRGNPLLVDMPGNIGLGHADLLVLDGQTYLYTSLDGETRSRLVLAWR